MFPKNDLELEIFSRKGPIFFSPKMFSKPYRLIERKKNRKKILSRKVVGTPWNYPQVNFSPFLKGFLRVSEVDLPHLSNGKSSDRQTLNSSMVD